jgi:hypothetical protein
VIKKSTPWHFWAEIIIDVATVLAEVLKKSKPRKR